jgi:hypothetical protein
MPQQVDGPQTGDAFGAAVPGDAGVAGAARILGDVHRPVRDGGCAAPGRYRQMATEWMEYLFMSLEELRAVVFSTRWEVADVFPKGAQYAAELRLRG